MDVFGPYEGQQMRIDLWLPTQLPYSRSFFHHIIERGGIKVEKPTQLANICKKSYLLQPGDTIYIDDVARHLSPLVLAEAPLIDIPVVYETDDYCVLDKPKGVLSHPNSIWDITTPSVVGFLYHRYKQLPSLGNFIRSGLLHRLDKDTDGFLVIAKTEKGLSYFKSLFQAKSLAATITEKEQVPLHKSYVADCLLTPQGKKFLTQISSQVPYTIIADVYAKVPHYIPKVGITKILGWSMALDSGTIGTSEQCSMNTIKLSIEILTGRTHQIRYHLSSYGLPIIGDYLYGFGDKIKKDKPTLHLSATSLSFRDCYGEDKVFEKLASNHCFTEIKGVGT